MKQSEAVRLIGFLNAYYPSRTLPAETIAVWSGELGPYELEDGLKAAQRLGTRAPHHPALAELLEEIRIVQRERIDAERRALPDPVGAFVSLEDYLAANPAARANWRRFRQAFGQTAEGGGN